MQPIAPLRVPRLYPEWASDWAPIERNLRKAIQSAWGCLGDEMNPARVHLLGFRGLTVVGFRVVGHNGTLPGRTDGILLKRRGPVWDV